MATIGERALALKLRGMTYEEVGAILKVSPQRAFQILAPPAGVKIALRARSGGKCEGCGMLLKKGAQQVHHKTRPETDPRVYNDVTELQYLCIACHRAAHLKMDPRPIRFRMPPAIRELRENLRSHGVTQDQIAQATGRTRPHINNVLCGRIKSRPVIEAALRLIAERRAAQATT